MIRSEVVRVIKFEQSHVAYCAEKCIARRKNAC